MGRRRAVLRALLGLFCLVLLLTGVLGYGLWQAVYRPTVDEPLPQADALLVLGPVDHKLDEAVQLMQRDAATTLVVSDQDQRDGESGECRPEVLEHLGDKEWIPDDDHPVLCFRPIPVTTQGEAMGLRALGQSHGWDSVNVLAYPEHVSRARLLVDRCWTDEVAYLAAPGSPASTSDEAARDAFWYQSGALVKAGLTPGCDTMLPSWLEQISWRL